MSRFSKRWSLVALVLIMVLVASLVTACAKGPKFKGKTLVITSYGGAWEEFFKKEIIPDFEKQTGAKVEVAVGLTKDWMAKIRAAGKDNPPYDVVMGNETYVSGVRNDGFFAKLPLDKVPNLKDVAPSLRIKDDAGVLALLNPLGIGYRTDLVKNPPKSWKDLWKPEYKGKLGLYSVNNSACPMQIMQIAKVFSGDPKNIDVAFQKIKELKPFKMTDFSGDMEKLLTQGEVEIGILDSPAWARLTQQGIKLGFVIPSDGMFTFEQDLNVLAGSKVKDLAFEWANYMLSPEVQTKWAKKFWVTPSNTKVVIDADLAKWIPVTKDNLSAITWWDWTWVNSGAKDKMIDRWNKEIAGK